MRTGLQEQGVDKNCDADSSDGTPCQDIPAVAARLGFAGTFGFDDRLKSEAAITHFSSPEFEYGSHPP